MAQIAFVKFDSIDGTNQLSTPQVTYVFQLIWVGDFLAGGTASDQIRVTEPVSATNNTIAADVKAAVIAKANALGYPSMTGADIRLVGGAVF